MASYSGWPCRYTVRNPSALVPRWKSPSIALDEHLQARTGDLAGGDLVPSRVRHVEAGVGAVQQGVVRLTARWGKTPQRLVCRRRRSMPWKCCMSAWVARHEHSVEVTCSAAHPTTSASGSQNGSSSSGGSTRWRRSRSARRGPLAQVVEGLGSARRCRPAVSGLRGRPGTVNGCTYSCTIVFAPPTSRMNCRSVTLQRRVGHHVQQPDVQLADVLRQGLLDPQHLLAGLRERAEARQRRVRDDGHRWSSWSWMRSVTLAVPPSVVPGRTGQRVRSASACSHRLTSTTAATTSTSPTPVSQGPPCS